MEHKEVLLWAEEAGFTHAAVIPREQLVFDPSLRRFCEENVCGNYGNNYSCPPACGTPEEMRKRTEQYRWAYIFQTITDVGSWDNMEGVVAAKASHNRRSRELIYRLRQAGLEGLPMLAGQCGACTVCRQIKGEPCPFPQECFSCISAYCMKAEQMANDAGLPYWCGDGVVAYFSLYLV